jgi:putative FmdB family regulatory protein
MDAARSETQDADATGAPDVMMRCRSWAMPLYEFVCRDCGSQFEQIQSFSAKGHPPCPQCGSEHVSRLLGRPAIHFKGSGWYINDSKGSSKQSANGDAGKDGGKEGGKEESKESAADAKPIAAAESTAESKSGDKPASKAESKGGGEKAGSKAAAKE